MCSATGYDNDMTTELENQPAQTGRRWRWQFSVRGVLIVVTLVCVVGGVYMWPILQRRADDARLKAYHAKWAEMSFRVNLDASRDDEVTELTYVRVRSNRLTTLPPEIGNLTTSTNASLN